MCFTWKIVGKETLKAIAVDYRAKENARNLSPATVKVVCHAKIVEAIPPGFVNNPLIWFCHRGVLTVFHLVWNTFYVVPVFESLNTADKSIMYREHSGVFFLRNFWMILFCFLCLFVFLNKFIINNCFPWKHFSSSGKCYPWKKPLNTTKRYPFFLYAKIQRKLWHLKWTQKISGLLRNRPLVTELKCLWTNLIAKCMSAKNKAFTQYVVWSQYFFRN